MGRRRSRLREEETSPAPLQLAREATPAAHRANPLTELQHTLGNQALSRLLRDGGSLQRAIPESANFVRNSDLGLLYRRSSELKAIDRALAAYEAVRESGGPGELQALLQILDAINAWRTSKSDADSGKRWPYINSVLQDVKKRFDTIVNEHREMWASGHFTDPALHDPSQYQYIINAVAEYNGKGQVEPTYISEALNDPTKLQNALLSLSVVTNLANPTWAPSGFVLNVPKQNIFAAKGSDIGTENRVSAQHESFIYRELVRLFIANGLPPPEQVLKGMKRHYENQQYYEQNEITALGMDRISQKGVEVTGIFVITDKGETDPMKPITLFEEVGRTEKDGKPMRLVRKIPGVSAERMKQYVDLAKKYNLPIIALPLNDTTRYRVQPGKPGPWAPDMMLALS